MLSWVRRSLCPRPAAGAPHIFLHRVVLERTTKVGFTRAKRSLLQPPLSSFGLQRAKLLPGKSASRRHDGAQRRRAACRGPTEVWSSEFGVQSTELCLGTTARAPSTVLHRNEASVDPKSLSVKTRVATESPGGRPILRLSGSGARAKREHAPLPG